MANRKTYSNNHLPIISSAQESEDESRLIFEASILPWMISAWTQRDFGIDATVEIVKNAISLEGKTVTGKRFSVQLKSSKSTAFNKPVLSLSIPTMKINYWRDSIEPVLLVFVDLNSKLLYYRWIDAELINELNKKDPSWIGRKSVSLIFDKNKLLNTKNLVHLEEYVLHWKRPPNTHLNPGSYFQHSKEAQHLIGLLKTTIHNHGIQAFSAELEALSDSCAQSIFTVAVVGPTNAGKSTLINCLLDKEISPVGMLPTTGIPIVINPGNENKISILFKDGKDLSGSLDDGLVEQYSSKKFNNRNKKGVKLVTVQIINLLMERGIAICDIPGLDDPDPEIRSITQTALYHVNAIVYLVGADSMSLSHSIIEDLKQLGGKMDRLFLVFNKIDLLGPDDLQDFQSYVEQTLDEYGVRKYLPSPPIYLSAKTSIESRNDTAGSMDTVKALEEPLWQYLLDANQSGLHKILGCFSDALVLVENYKSTVNALKLNTEERSSLQSEIAQVRSEIGELRSLVGKERKELQTSIQEFLTNSFSHKLQYLKTHFSELPFETPLPSNKGMSDWLQQNTLDVLSITNSEVQQRIYELQSNVNHWVSEKLKQINIDLSNDGNNGNIDLPDIHVYVNQVDQFIYGGRLGPIGMLESFFHQLDTIFNWVVIKVENVITSDFKLKQRQVGVIMRNSKRSFDTISKRYTGHIDAYLSTKARLIEEKAVDRTNVYLAQLDMRLRDVPLTKESETEIDTHAFLEDLSEIEIALKENLIHLKDKTDGIQ